eukprot:2967304-Karenia_brevis.AAC.1
MRCNEADMVGREGAVHFTLDRLKQTKETKGQNNPQDAWLWPGMKVIACKTLYGCGLENEVEYRIKELGDR